MSSKDMRAALKSALIDLKKQMRHKRASRFKKAEEKEEHEDQEMDEGRDDSGHSRADSSDRPDGGAVEKGEKASASSEAGDDDFREKMKSFMKGGSSAKAGKTAALIGDASKKRSPSKKPPVAAKKGREFAG